MLPFGLRSAAPSHEDLVPVGSAAVDDPQTGFSEDAARVTRLLTDAGVEAHQRPYVLPDRAINSLPLAQSPNPVDRIRIAVVVHATDLERAKEILRTHPESVGGFGDIQHDRWLRSGH